MNCRFCGATFRCVTSSNCYCSVWCQLWSRVERRQGGCWLWRGARQTNGYGHMRVGGRSGKSEAPHRLVAAMTIGPVDGIFVLHSCDNPLCCNPAHLWLGTQKDNMVDMSRKGRSGPANSPWLMVRGEGHANARLNDEAVRTIRAKHAAGESVASMARLFGVAPFTVHSVIVGRTWRHVQSLTDALKIALAT